MLRVRQANCYADFSGNCPAASWLLRQPLHGHLPALRKMFPGNCPANASMIHRMLRGRYADIARLAALLSCKGMVSIKMTGFPIPESREKFRSAERIQIHATMCKCQSTERAVLKSKRNGAGWE